MTPPYPPNLRYRLEYVGYLLLAGIFALLPVKAASEFGAWIVGAVGPLSRQRHPRMLQNLAQAFPEKSEDERKAIARGVWRNLGRVLGEFFHLAEFDPERVYFENPEVLTGIAASGSGSVLCGSHLANWEANSAGMTLCGLDAVGVYHPMSNPFVDADVKRRRANFYRGGLLAKRDPATPRMMMRYAREGKAAAFLIDQSTFNGLMIPFFGRLASTTQFPALIARQFNLPLVLVISVREPGPRFRLTSKEIEVPRTEDKEADIFAATAAMQAHLESAVRRHPEQWMWTHSRWS